LLRQIKALKQPDQKQQCFKETKRRKTGVLEANHQNQKTITIPVINCAFSLKQLICNGNTAITS